MNPVFPNVENPFRKGMSTYGHPFCGTLFHVRSAWRLVTSYPEFVLALHGLISACPFDSLYSFDTQKKYISQFQSFVTFYW